MRPIEEAVLTRYKTHKKEKKQTDTRIKEEEESSLFINFNNIEI